MNLTPEGHVLNKKEEVEFMLKNAEHRKTITMSWNRQQILNFCYTYNCKPSEIAKVLKASIFKMEYKPYYRPLLMLADDPSTSERGLIDFVQKLKTNPELKARFERIYNA